MAAGTGETTLDFGATGSDLAEVAVARASVLSTTHVEAYLYPKDTADHNVDEHLVDGPLVFAHSVSAGVGFTITGRAPDDHRTLTGLYTVRWVATD